uniref:Uncharacterized protein n=1 Tax=Arundo donax TaxID=35708 RepID=A0A0A9G093_ARUDO
MHICIRLDLLTSFMLFDQDMLCDGLLL